ncbi:hypothetical protein CEXT_75811 [Caerostris extrusa]|uniref:Uncharacterized protein n=1 Tax=Caerostris extrusa TaxID=172846 RepID=A0AAV4WUU2_CAEEX|nr:hypothetical protein CEXT_75811 [Caerostris extrusa]
MTGRAILPAMRIFVIILKVSLNETDTRSVTGQPSMPQQRPDTEIAGRFDRWLTEIYVMLMSDPTLTGLRQMGLQEKWGEY